MAKLNDRAQWIVLLGFIVAASLFFLAIIVNESVTVGQTTAEATLDFPKSNIVDLNHEIQNMSRYDNASLNMDAINSSDSQTITRELSWLYSNRTAAIILINYETVPPANVSLHYNNGITTYDYYFEEHP